MARFILKVQGYFFCHLYPHTGNCKKEKWCTKMNNLMQIQPFIQTCCIAISSILDAEVTVIDDQLIRVGGTGDYEQQTGKKISHDSFFQRVLHTGKPGIIKDVKKEFACYNCESHLNCKELANLAYPIFLKDNVIGIIGIIAFREQERERLLRDQKKLEEFLRCMSILIESKIITYRQSVDFESQIREVISEENRNVKANQFLGNNPKIVEILQLVKKISTSNSSVLITGESGTGKEVLAKMIHSSSARSDKLMITVNCSAIPETLVESELFGYEGGAFTGAKKQGHIGKFELANNSTLFLDEIGEIPTHVQPKLLRVLQEQTVERLGSKLPIPIDVRVICATNRDLFQMIEEGTFRQDLFYRLNVIPIELPPLRERKEDIPLFIRTFIEYYNKRLKKQIKGVSPAVEKILIHYDWPGNVRELKNIIEYLENVADEEIIEISDLPDHFFIRANTNLSDKPLHELMNEYEKHILEKLVLKAPTLEKKDALAEQLGISRATLYRKLSAYKLL